MEDCIVSVRQPPLGLRILGEGWLCHRRMHVFTALHSSVYVWYVCGSNKCMLLQLFWYIMKFCAFLLQSAQFHYGSKQWKIYRNKQWKNYGNKQWKQTKNILNENHASRVGEKVGLVKKYWSKTTNVWHPQMQHSVLLQPWFTLSTMPLSCT